MCVTRDVQWENSGVVHVHPFPPLVSTTSETLNNLQENCTVTSQHVKSIPIGSLIIQVTPSTAPLIGKEDPLTFEVISIVFI